LHSVQFMNESSKTNEFLRLLMTNQKRIYAFILGMVPNHQDADDLFQETVLVMWSKFDEFEPGTNFTVWGLTIARYQILSVRKRHACRGFQFSQAALDLLQKDSESFVRQLDGRLHILRTCVRKLTPNDHTLIRLRYEEEVTIRIIAERWNQSVQSIYKRLARVHDMLLRCIRRSMRTEGLT